MNNIYYTADCHLNHDAIRIHCNRPWPTVEEMDNAIIANWNNCVDKKDLVYILGDFAWKNQSHYFHMLNGKKILIRGNHDKMNEKMLRNFTEVHYFLHRVIDKMQVTMCHYPMLSWPGSCYKNNIMLHGHCHGRIKEYPDCYRMDVGIDVFNYKPIPWEFIKYKMSLKQKKEGSPNNEILDNVVNNNQYNISLFEQWQNCK